MKTTKNINGKEIEVFDLETITEMELGKDYKVIQLTINEKPTIIFGNQDNYHSEILEAYLLEKQIPYTKTKVEATPNPGPAKEAEEYQITGAGRSNFDGVTLMLKDNSTGYNIGPNKEEGLKAIKNRELKINLKTDILEGDELLNIKLDILHKCLTETQLEDAYEQVEKLYKTNDEDLKKNILNIEQKIFDLISYASKGKNAATPDYIEKLKELRDILLAEEKYI